MTLDTASSTLRVVIVDDTADLRELMRHALTRGGMNVVGEAGDGRAGIEVVRQLRPDVVLLDLSMPVMDGLEALPQMRADVPDAKIIVLSGFDATKMAERAMAIGAHGYMQKGASLGRVLDQIRDIVGGRDAAGPAPVRSAPEPTRPAASTLAATETALAPQCGIVGQAPFGIIEITAEPPYGLVTINEAARTLIGTEPRRGAPIAEVAPEIFNAIVNSRLSGDSEFETTLHDRPVRLTVRHSATSLLLYVNELAADVARLRTAIATTAHELRGPVAVLCAVAETVLEDDLAPEHVERLMLAVTRQAKLLDNITGDLLVGAQVERGTLRLETQPLDPVALVEAVMADHGLPLADLHVTDTRPVLADPLRLQQMLGNLFSNAAKYGAPPVLVRIRASSEHGGLVGIDVEDHGPGVPAGFAPQLFREFTRAGVAATPGTGLGLSVVHTLATMQSGSLTYAPRPGGGSVFTINLPAASR